MEETAATIHGSKCLVMGYGRIGKILANALKCLGAEVTVSARKYSDFAWIKADGYRCIETDKVADIISEQNIVFNTIPYIVLDENVLTRVNPKALIIDLASKPGGVGFKLDKAKATPWLSARA